MVKFVVFPQQPNSQDLCVNIAHIRSKTFCCVRKHIKFVNLSFQVLIKWYMLLLNAKIIKTSFLHYTTGCQHFSTEYVLQLSTKQLYQRINHCILVINIFTCMLYFWKLYSGYLLNKI